MGAVLRDLFAVAEDPVRVAGYMLAVYGSALTSTHPKDIDLLLVPWTPHARPASGIGALVNALPHSLLHGGPPYRGAMGTMAVFVAWRGWLLDVVVREVVE